MGTASWHQQEEERLKGKKTVREGAKRRKNRRGIEHQRGHELQEKVQGGTETNPTQGDSANRRTRWPKFFAVQQHGCAEASSWVAEICPIHAEVHCMYFRTRLLRRSLSTPCNSLIVLLPSLHSWLRWGGFLSRHY